MTTSLVNVSKYINDLFVPQDEALRQAITGSQKKGLPDISILPEEGRFFQVLVRACGVKKAVEIGTLGGYSGIWIARGLLPGGKLITLEKDPRHAEVAWENFSAAGVTDRVELRQGNAHDLLQALRTEAPFDFIFIDAEKSGYGEYLQWAIENVRIGGLIAAHNTLRGGNIVGDEPSDPNTMIMREFNRLVASDKRLMSIIYPAGDGTLLSVRVE